MSLLLLSFGDILKWNITFFFELKFASVGENVPGFNQTLLKHFI